MSIKVSDYIASFIAAQGVREVFLVSGGANVNIIDAISQHDKINYICNHHEQASAMAAEAYSRVTGNLGVCLVTMGPGMTNTITGIAGAWLDSIPVLYISGQVKRDNMIGDSGLRQLGVQEINAVALAQPITKYAVCVADPQDIRYELEKAVYLAKSGRPGPVLLDIPADVQTSMIEEHELRSFKPEIKDVAEKRRLKAQVAELVLMIKAAKRPLIFAGHGIRLAKGQENFLELANILNIPIVTSMSAHDLISADNPLCIGRPGVFGDRAGNFATQNCDLLISIGARLHLWNIGYNYNEFAKNAKKVIVDIDELELKKKTVHSDLPICADAHDFLKEFSEQVSKESLPDISTWVQKCQTWKKRYPVVLPEYAIEKDYVNSYFFTDRLAAQLKEKDIILTGVGTSFTGTLQCFKTKLGQRLISNVGCAAMGYDLPAAIGACFASGKKPIILIVGDGSIMMNLQELQVIKHHHLPIKIFLLNNQGYLAIKNTQNSFFGGRLEASDQDSGISFPDFGKVALAFELPYMTIKDHEGIDGSIAKALAQNGPILVDINMSPSQPLIPKVYSMKKLDGSMDSKPIEDMYPFLDPDEMAANMQNN